MKTNESSNNIEQQIILAAKQVFIKNGYAETSMSDIAVKAGINRSGLHYYFRTKEKMFNAVFADIVLSFIPKIHDIVSWDIPIGERLSNIVDVYFELFKKEPRLPMFILKEIQRDAMHLFNTVDKSGIYQYVKKIRFSLEAEMKKGSMKQVPVEFVFYTLYGMIVLPFVTRPLADIISGKGRNCDFDDKLSKWKMYIVSQMEYMLSPDK